MPVTPFHFGPGLVLKAVAPRHVSLSVFVGANVVIDLEPIAWFLLTGDPVHGLLHTAIGATVLALICSYWGRSGCERLLRLWNSSLDPAQSKWLAVVPKIAPRTAAISALLGTWSHILLDGIMHVDVQLLWPVSASNEIGGLIDLDYLHLLCMFLGIAGAGRLVAVRWKQEAIDSPWLRRGMASARIQRPDRRRPRELLAAVTDFLVGVISRIAAGTPRGVNSRRRRWPSRAARPACNPGRGCHR